MQIPAADLLAAGDVGPILVECRERIERDAPPEERENLRVATHFFTA